MKAFLPLSAGRIGETGLLLPELGFGGAPLGNLYHPISDAEAEDVVQAAVSAGYTYFDTAPFYGFGLSERRIGNTLRDLDRHNFVLSTKVGRLLRTNREYKGLSLRHGYRSPMPFDTVFDYSYEGMMKSYEMSIQRLGLAKIDILFVHDIGTATHSEQNANYFKDLAESGIRALEELRDNGDISAYGLGVNEWEVCEDALQIGRFDCFLLAGRYTLLEQKAIESFMPKCQKYGATLIIGGAYNSGILATGVKNQQTLYYNYEPAPPSIVRRVAEIESVCEAHSVTLAAAALQFPLAHPLVSCVLLGLQDQRRASESIKLYHEKIPADFWTDLKEHNLLLPGVPTP